MWRWYINGRLVSETKLKALFKPTPFVMKARIDGTALGVGQGKVELLLDGAIFDSQEFEVVD